MSWLTITFRYCDLGFQESYWNYANTISNASLYPALAFATIFNSSEDSMPFHTSYSIKLGLAIFFTIPNLIQLKIVGNSLFFLTGVLLVPFFVLMIETLPQVHWDVLTQVNKSSLSWGSVTVKLPLIFNHDNFQVS